MLIDGPDDAATTLILAHGAGAPMDSDWMNAIARGIAVNGVRVVRFEFPYMAERRTTGRRRAPDREPILLKRWRDVYAEVDRGQTFIGGKSMGGRMASMVADELGAAGLLCLGYPFHPPGRPEKTRVAHLEGLRTRTLIVQGSADPFGTRDDVAGYQLSDAITIEWIEGGNHDLVAKGFGPAASRARVVELATLFLT